MFQFPFSPSPAINKSRRLMLARWLADEIARLTKNYERQTKMLPTLGYANPTVQPLTDEIEHIAKYGAWDDDNDDDL